MRRNDLAMRERLVEELYKIAPNYILISEKLGCSRQLVLQWLRQESLPGCWYLRELHNAGCDVIYILTGGDTRCTTHR